MLAVRVHVVRAVSETYLSPHTGALTPRFGTKLSLPPQNLLWVALDSKSHWATCFLKKQMEEERKITKAMIKNCYDKLKKHFAMHAVAVYTMRACVCN